MVYTLTSEYQSPKRPADILLVEDNPGDVLLLKEFLKCAKMPYNLHVAEDGEEALLFLNQSEKSRNSPRPDLIILDLNLPKVDGFEVLQQVKQDPRFKRIPVIILTSSHAEMDIARSYDLHANCYITKSSELKEFSEIVKSIEHFWFEIARLPKVGGSC